MTAPEITDDLKEAAAPRLFDVQAVDHTLSLAERFVLPPFTQLDARSGTWQERKKLWIGLGLKSGGGRTARTFCGHSPTKNAFVDALARQPDKSKKSIQAAIEESGIDEASAKTLALTDGQSIFDPVLCEMAYRWFCPPGGRILDPFAGGSVRGLVAAVCKRRYEGIDLSAEQVLANEMQRNDFVDREIFDTRWNPVWFTGDSDEVLDDFARIRPGYDFVFSCPPYHDLEKYSTDPNDLSNMDWGGFRGAYRSIIGKSVDHLTDDRFAAFVVGEIRGPDGYYRHFVQETIDAFELAGAAYYNEAIFVTPAGTLPIRAAKQFVTSRKLGRTHQTVLVFVKGDPKAATRACADQAAEAAALKAAGVTLTDDAEDDADFSGMGHG